MTVKTALSLRRKLRTLPIFSHVPGLSTRLKADVLRRVRLLQPDQVSIHRWHLAHLSASILVRLGDLGVKIGKHVEKDQIGREICKPHTSCSISF